jgi:hypothetical protein
VTGDQLPVTVHRPFVFAFVPTSALVALDACYDRFNKSLPGGWTLVLLVVGLAFGLVTLGVDYRTQTKHHCSVGADTAS